MNPSSPPKTYGYNPEEYANILKELVNPNPRVIVESQSLKKGADGWIKGNKFEEQQKSRLELNGWVLKFLCDGAKGGLLSHPDVETGLRKLQGRVSRHEAFQNNAWLRNALNLCSVPLIHHKPFVFPADTYSKVEEVRKEFCQHCENINKAGARPTFAKFDKAYFIPVGPEPKLYAKMHALALKVVAAAARILRLRKLSLKYAEKSAKLWTSNAGIRNTLGIAYALNDNPAGALEHLRAATLLNPKHGGYQQDLVEKLKEYNYQEGIMHMLEDRMQNPKSLLASMGEAKLRKYGESARTLDAIDKFAEGKDQEAIEIILKQTLESMFLSNEDREKFLLQWKNSKIQCREPVTKWIYAENELSKIFRSDVRLKKNFAFMHADAYLNKEPLLKNLPGSMQNFTGPYFLYFLKLNGEKYGLGEFTKNFQASLEAWEKLKFSFLDIKEAENMLKKIKNVFQKSLDTVKELLELENYKSQSKKKQFLKDYADFNVERISKLKAGEYHIILINWFYSDKNSGHAVVLQIMKQKDDRYSLVLINTGDGLYQNHRAIFGRKFKFNPYYVIKNIPAKNLLNPASPFYSCVEKFDLGMAKVNSAKQVYDEFLAILGGVREPKPASENLRQVITPQRSGTCAWCPFLALLKMHMPSQKYKEFVFQMKAQSIIQFHDLLKENLEWDGQARRLLEIALDDYQKRKSKMAKLQGEKGIKHLLNESEWHRLEELRGLFLTV